MSGADAKTPGEPGRLLVVGAGLVGTSIALAAGAAGWRVWIQDADPVSQGLAVGLGAGEPGPPAVDPDLVVVAVPPRITPTVVSNVLSTYLGATVSDVSSIKSDVVAEVELLSAHADRFVPGHPLAGSEVSGARGARATLFRDRVWVLTPTATTDRVRTDAVSRFATALGAVAVEWDATAHDRAVALTSHLPQLLSSVLATRLTAGGDDTGLAGQGLRDMTRIAASDPVLWTQILTANAGPVLAALDPLVADLERVREALRSITRDGPSADAVAVVAQALERGNEGRARIPGKHGTGTGGPTGVLVVVVPDEPGQLAALFALAGGARVNLEDVRIDHALGRPTGLVELEVALDQVDPLRAALVTGGWTVLETGR